jgi:hypothetical protein
MDDRKRRPRASWPVSVGSGRGRAPHWREFRWGKHERRVGDVSSLRV